MGRHRLAADRHRHGVLQHRLPRLDPGERRLEPARRSHLVDHVMRIVGNSVGAAVFGAILNFGVSRRIPEAGDAVNRLLQPAARHGLGAAEIARVSDAIAAGLHNVYVVAGAVAIVSLVLALALPTRLSPTQPAANPRDGSPNTRYGLGCRSSLARLNRIRSANLRCQPSVGSDPLKVGHSSTARTMPSGSNEALDP